MGPILTAITALIEFLIIILSRTREVEKNKIEENNELKEENNELKEEMHKALLAVDNSAIVRCLNKYGKLRQNKTDTP